MEENWVLAQLGPLMCWCRLLCWDSAIEAQFIGGHQSLCSLCKTAEKLLTASYLRLCNCHFRTNVEFLPHDEKYERIILSHQSADTVALHKHELMIILHLRLNEKTWRKNLFERKSFWLVTIKCTKTTGKACDYTSMITEFALFFFFSVENYWLIFFTHCITHSNAKKGSVVSVHLSIKVKDYTIFKEFVRDTKRTGCSKNPGTQCFWHSSGVFEIQERLRLQWD